LTVTVSYSGTSGIAPSTTTTTISVSRGMVQITATVTPLGGGLARYYAKVTAKTAGFGPPGGSVVFLAADGAICAHALVDHVASCTAAIATGTVRVSYRPGKDYQAPKTDPVATRP
jgi:hypothetical protein